MPPGHGGGCTADIRTCSHCHRTIHAALTNRELERDYADPAALRAHPEIARFLDWIRGKEPDFHAPIHARKR